MNRQMRKAHITNALVHLRNAREQTEEARLFLFDLENVGGIRADVSEIKAALVAAETVLKRQARNEGLIP